MVVVYFLQFLYFFIINYTLPTVILINFITYNIILIFLFYHKPLDFRMFKTDPVNYFKAFWHLSFPPGQLKAE